MLTEARLKEILDTADDQFLNDDERIMSPLLFECVYEIQRLRTALEEITISEVCDSYDECASCRIARQALGIEK